MREAANPPRVSDFAAPNSFTLLVTVVTITSPHMEYTVVRAC
jgi:hypothetical protein